jgi:hypothetical protein
MDLLTNAMDFFLPIARGYRVIHTEVVKLTMYNLVGFDPLFLSSPQNALLKVEARSILPLYRRRTGLLRGISASLTIHAAIHIDLISMASIFTKHRYFQHAGTNMTNYLSVPYGDLFMIRETPDAERSRTRESLDPAVLAGFAWKALERTIDSHVYE